MRKITAVTVLALLLAGCGASGGAAVERVTPSSTTATTTTTTAPTTTTTLPAPALTSDQIADITRYIDQMAEGAATVRRDCGGDEPTFQCGVAIGPGIGIAGEAANLARATIRLHIKGDVAAEYQQGITALDVALVVRDRLIACWKADPNDVCEEEVNVMVAALDDAAAKMAPWRTLSPT